VSVTSVAFWIACSLAYQGFRSIVVFPPDQIVPVVRSADIGMVLYEPRSLNYHCALPNGFFHLLAAGLPLVRAPLSEIENLIGGRAVGLLLDRMDAATMAAAILDCECEAKRWDAEAAALGAELSWRLEAGRIEDLIVRIMTGKRPRLYQPVEKGRAAAWP
jgi:hypothetical protein